MKFIDGTLRLSATDLSKHLGCAHLTTLDRELASGQLARIYRNDPSIEVLERRGKEHEKAYIEHLRSRGLRVHENPASTAATIEAMMAGIEAITQARLENSGWRGFARCSAEGSRAEQARAVVL